MKARGYADDAPLHVPVIYKSLGRYPHSFGDYAIQGFEKRCCIERKSMDDCHGTLLGWGSGRRMRFESELENLASTEAPLVLVECSMDDLLLHAPETDNKTSETNRKILHSTIVSYMQDYKVPWLFRSTRRRAEVTAFRWLERFWRKHRDE